ncbi:MAG TPA: LacI family DNA-binding transcriptional regulator [Granulicella sp.]|nr:LacI family DNA-binding transcriptional regulator [Granulicella sp.]
MRDVAELAGVGTMTVSRVLSGSVPVSEATRKRVERAIATLHFRPNEVARSLREARTRSIGIIVPELTDPFFALCAQAASHAAKEHSYSFMMTTSDEDPETEYAEANLMLRRHVEGLIVIPAADGASRLTQPEFTSIPIVAIDRPIRGSHFSTVLVENKLGARLAVQHLLEHNHRRIAFLSLSDKLFTLNARRDAYVESMEQAGLVPEAYPNCATQQQTLDLLRSLQEAGRLPTALFIANHPVMQFVLHALQQLRIKVPETIALIGFDDFEMAELVQPAITVVRQPREELGRVAAAILFERLQESSAPAKAKRRVLPVELVVRRSCGCMP